MTEIIITYKIAVRGFYDKKIRLSKRGAHWWMWHFLLYRIARESLADLYDISANKMRNEPYI